MTKTEEQKPNDTHLYSTQLSSLPPKRYPIICKFWMMGNCLKEERCGYLHSEKEKRGLTLNRSIVDNDTECPMYSLGFCKNGSICNFKHTACKLELEECDKLPELPIWYLEYVLGKPISLIFEDFEEQNKAEVEKLIQKVCITKQFDKPEKQYNGKPLPTLMYQNSMTPVKYPYQFQSHQNALTGHTQNDIYSEKKDFIIRSLSKKVRYFLFRTNNMNYVKFAMEHNIVINIKQNSIKLKEALKSCDEVLLIMFDEQSLNFNGFCKYRKELTDKDQEYTSLIIDNPMLSGFKINQNTSYLKIEWYWKTKLSYDKVELLKNPLNNDELLVDSKDCQEISMDVGNYVCRLMIKRLSKFEVKEYIDKRKANDDLIANKLSDKDTNANCNSSNMSNINLNSLIFEEISKNNINKSLVFQTSSNNDCTNNSVSKSSNNNIIVTNISNLQVNISQNSYRSSDYKKTGEDDRRKRRKEKSRSRSRDDKYSKYKKLRSRRSRSRSLRRNDRNKITKRKVSDENEINYDSDETVIMKEGSIGVKVKNYKNQIELRSDLKNFPDDYDSIRNDKKTPKTTLFSNAMKKIALQSVKHK